MPSFYNPHRNYIITTSLKVMYSTLSRQPSLQPLRRDFDAAVKLWLTRGIRRYLVVRDPYDRLVSFYMNKLYTCQPRGGSMKWEDCQRIFFPALGVSGSEDPAVIAARLRSVSFERFAELLPEVFRNERHLWPQCWSLRYRIRGLPLPTPLHRVLKLEYDREVLVGDLGIDMTIRVNPTEHGTHDRYFTAASYAVANAVYRCDFERFGYAYAPIVTRAGELAAIPKRDSRPLLGQRSA